MVYATERNVKAQNIAVDAMVTNCSVSHDARGKRKFCDVCTVCRDVMDGRNVTGWVTSVKTLNEWIQLSFADHHTVFRVDMYHRCKNSAQCSGLNITFSDGTKTFVSTTIATAHQSNTLVYSSVSETTIKIYIALLR